MQKPQLRHETPLEFLAQPVCCPPASFYYGEVYTPKHFRPILGGNMQKFVLALSFLLVGTLASQGQPDQNSFSSNSTGSSHSSFSGSVSPPDYRKKDAPIGSLSEDFIYMYAPGQYGANRSLMGWEVVPTLTPA